MHAAVDLQCQCTIKSKHIGFKESPSDGELSVVPT